MSGALNTLLSILDIETLGDNAFRGRSPKTGWQRVFGGQVIGQALVAAQRTVTPDRHVHSLHAYFMRPGDPAVPIDYEAERTRDGQSFSTRHVTAFQHGKAIFALSASFQADEEGLDFHMEAPAEVPRPDMLLSEKELIARFIDRVPESVRRYWERERPIEMKPVNIDHYISNRPQPPRQHVWFRVTGEVPDDRALQAAVLAYISDMTLIDTATYPHGRAVFDPELQMASLDHSMWFHRPNRLDDWLLYTQDTPSSSGSRGFARGSIYALDGTLIASTAQEGLMRLRSPKK